MADTTHPVLRPQEIPYVLQHVAPEHSECSSKAVPDLEARFRANPEAAAWIVEDYGNTTGSYVSGKWISVDLPGDCFKWQDHWRNIPYELLRQVFTISELCCLWQDEIVMSRLSEHIRENEPILHKVGNSLFHYGEKRGRDYNALVDGVNGLRALSTDLPGFDFRITYTWSYEAQGTAQHKIPCKADPEKDYIWLDSVFGLMVYYKGEHVLTIGFSIADNGIRVSQVQLRSKKGNRFLYHLGCHYFDWAIDVLGRAFGHENLWLVTGDSALDAVIKAYKVWEPKPEVEARVRDLYNRPLTSYQRTEETVDHRRRVFVRLTRAVAEQKAAA